MKNLFLLLILVIVVGGGFYYLKNNRNETVKKSTENVSETQSSLKEFSMTAKQWAFDPAVITVKQGDKVKINIKSVDVNHGFGLPDFNIDQKLEPGKEVTVEFVASKKGEFSFHCSVMCGAGHREMTGKLVVE